MTTTKLILTAFILVLLMACSKKVSRVEADSTIDLSGKWNDVDSRLVAEAMIEDCLRSQWLYKYKEMRLIKVSYVLRAFP